LARAGRQRCTTAFLEDIAAAADRYGCAIHTHVLETRTQALTAELEHGRTLIAYLDGLGFLGPRVTINHGIWLTDDDIDRLGRNGCAVTHNPLSNLKLGSGTCPVRRLLDAGVAVALGTDGLATSDTGDLVAALRAAALVHKVTTTRYEDWVSAADAFAMATRGGARTGLMADDLGVIAPGRRADLALFDRRDWGFVPLHDPVAQLAFSVSSEAVRTVIVDGRIVMRDRTLTTIDEDAARATVAEAAERWRRTVKPAALEAAGALSPAMDGMYRKAMESYRTEAWAAPLRRRYDGL